MVPPRKVSPLAMAWRMSGGAHGGKTPHSRISTLALVPRQAHFSTGAAPLPAPLPLGRPGGCAFAFPLPPTPSTALSSTSPPEGVPRNSHRARIVDTPASPHRQLQNSLQL